MFGDFLRVTRYKLLITPAMTAVITTDIMIIKVLLWLLPLVLLVRAMDSANGWPL
jgi:hypothetical protein